MNRISTHWAMLVVIGSLFAACGKDQPVRSSSANPNAEQAPPLSSIQVAADFDFATSKTVEASIGVLDPLGNPLAGIRVDLYLPEGENLRQLNSGATDENGLYTAVLNLPSYVDAIVAEVNYIGIVPGNIHVPIVENEAAHQFGGAPPTRSSSSVTPTPRGKFAATMADFNFMGSWNSDGVPDYLETERDPIDGFFLRDINSSLPEKRPVPSYNPEYLASGVETNIVLDAESDVWITFVHEGAGWRNALGYYTYDINNPPSSADDLDLTIVFPNVSAAGSGGGLYPGDKVYLGRFAANSAIGWFLVAQSWSGSTATDGRYIVYSNETFNPESDPTYRQHNVLLNDADREVILLGFEDINREWNGCDNDFNDAVFYVTTNPYEAVQTQNIPDYKPFVDADGDQIEDYYDDYPQDGTRAFNNYYPARDTYGTLAYEDLWPHRGDYDFNDLVVDYHFNAITNANNKTVTLKGTFRVKAAGASYHNGLGIEFPLEPGQIGSVSGNRLGRGYIKEAGNGVEEGQDKAVVIVFDDAYYLLNASNDYYINTQLEAPFVAPVELEVTIELNAPTRLSAPPPYNTFAIINNDRSKEVHLAGYAPTSKVNGELFDSGDDFSASRGWYKTERNLPWGIHLINSWRHPIEKMPIDQAYYYFAAWAESGGREHGDWYKASDQKADLSRLYPTLD